MPTPEPEITEIAAILAHRLPEPGVPEPAAKEAWRGALRYARAAGIIGEITEKIAQDDPTLAPLCERLER